MFEPSRRPATVFIAVNTGAMTTSQWFAFATSGFKARAVSTASLSVLYIFQLPAITGLRIRSVCAGTNERGILAELDVSEQRFEFGDFFVAAVVTHAIDHLFGSK